MKKLGLLFVIVILGTTISMAQNNGGQRMNPEEMAKKQTAELKEVLGLDKLQEKNVAEINLNAAKEMAEMRKSREEGSDREAMREKMDAARKKTDTEMKKVLTEDQYEKYKTYLEEKRKERSQRGGQQGK
jgi:Spy/CpxP family protein refolding chaperone